MHTIKNSPSRRAVVAASLAGGLTLSTGTASTYGQDGGHPREATIRVGSNVVTLVNIFSVEPENQQKLLAVLKEGTDAFFSKMPGFISSSVLSGKNGRQAINYSQWQSAAYIDAFRQNPYFGTYIQRITALASGETVLCDVTYVHVL